MSWQPDNQTDYHSDHILDGRQTINNCKYAERRPLETTQTQYVGPIITSGPRVHVIRHDQPHVLCHHVCAFDTADFTTVEAELNVASLSEPYEIETISVENFERQILTITYSRTACQVNRVNEFVNSFTYCLFFKEYVITISSYSTYL